MKRTTYWLILALVAGGLGACGGDDAIIGNLVANSPPDTDVTATPPILSATEFEVAFNWAGSDPDGQVVGYEWRISNNGPDGILDIGDTLGLPWEYTEVTDSVFVVSADLDSFPPDVADSNQESRHYRFWQTHTFMIRAIDDLGASDPSPANVSFTATTLAPTVNINLPEVTVGPSCLQGPKVLTFGWGASDPDALSGEPESVRYLLIPYQTDPPPPASPQCKTETEFVRENPISNDNPAWSDWIPFDAPEDSGKVVTFPAQDAGKKFLFAVQARDVAGAVTPTFQWGRNVRHIETTNSKFPDLTVTEQFLGTLGFSGRFNLRSFDVVEGQPLRFSWFADATEYAGLIDAYRYGWDVQDLEDPNDPGWAVSWGNTAAHRSAPERSFSQGTHNFVIQCRDNSGTVSRAIYQVVVIQIPDPSEQRPLLLVDDRREDVPDSPIDAQWDAQWDAALQGRVVNFQPNDVIEAATEGVRINFATIADYSNLIWFTNRNANSYFQNNFAPANRLVPRFNWLEIYQARVGNILLTGPGSLANTVERDEWVYPIVFNVSTGQPGFGFGTFIDSDGTRSNRGTLRWPYTGWCVETIDMLRPGIGFIYGEHDVSGIRLRTMDCDRMNTAALENHRAGDDGVDRDDPFIARYPEADSFYGMGDLRPDEVRSDRNSWGTYQFFQEEAYNSNSTTRAVAILPRDCQLPMYRWVSWRDSPDEGDIPDESQCLPRDSETSTFNGAIVGIVSTTYEDQKPSRGATDIAWGFNPWGFRQDDVEKALTWMLESNWELQLLR